MSLCLRIAPVFAVCVLLFTTSGFSQINDNFSDGDFVADPVWSGTTENYIVNTDLELQLNDDEAGFSYLSSGGTTQSIDDREWRFKLELDFSPSGNNNCRFYLASVTGDLTYAGESACGASGYFLQFGESGSDDAIRLFRDDDVGDSPVELGAGTLGLLASSFEVGVKVTRSSLGDWAVYMDTNGGENYQLQFLANDASYSEMTHVGWTSKYTVSNADACFLDDVFFGEIEVDTEAPSVISHQVLSANEVEVSFSESISIETGEEASHYLLNGSTEPQSVDLEEDLQSVVLTFSDDFIEDVEQSLELEGLEDLSGNQMESTDILFTWSVPAEPMFRDVVINEIMADPNPVVELPEVEYVELRNCTNNTFNLANWVFVNTSTDMLLPNYMLGPGQFVILCDASDQAAMSDYGSVIGISSFTALSNLEDNLSLKDPLGNTIDAVDYTLDWYDVEGTDDGGFSLEQRNPFSPCIQGAANWGSSLAADGGTPGTENTIFTDVPDVQPPAVNDAYAVEPNLIYVLFDEGLNTDILDIDDFTLISGQVISSWSAEEEDLLVFELDEPLVLDQQYELELTNIMDCSGNIISEIISLSIIPGFQPLEGELIINEIMADPDDNFPSPNAEYVEIYNTSPLILQLRGLELSDAFVEHSALLYPGEYVVLHDKLESAAFTGVSNSLGLHAFPGLTNSGRELSLRNASDEELDYVNYDISWYQDTDRDDGGFSLELINPNDPCSDKDNWRASLASSGATPGTQNSVYNVEPDELAPEALYVLVWANDSIEVFFNEPLNFDNLNEWVLDVWHPSLTPEFEIETVEMGQINSVLVVFTSDMPESSNWILNHSGITDCWGNALTNGAADFTSVDDYTPGDLIINEVLFNPMGESVDYVELHNLSDKNISLEGFFLCEREDNLIVESTLVSEVPIVIPSGGYLFLSENAQSVAYQYPFTQLQNAWEMEDFPSYANDRGEVVLLDPLGLLMAEMNYDEDMHFALLDDVDGVSLERLIPEGPSLDESNWHSAAASHNYGTPGYKNSQDVSALSSGLFTVYPEIFSPDNDGYQDVLTISYDLGEEGVVGNVRIFDRLGIEKRYLVKNELLATEGVWTWDGLAENGEKLSPGVYIIYVETFDLDGQVNENKLVCVIGQFLE